MTALFHEPPQSLAAEDIDTIRALCHDLRQPLAAIMLLASSPDGDVGRKLAIISDQTQWLRELVEVVLGDAATDQEAWVDVAALAEEAALRGRPTAECDIRLVGASTAGAWARPVALARALGCVLDNAIRAAGPGGHVVIDVRQTRDGVTLAITDDGPGPGKIVSQTSLGLTTTRAMIASCRGSFALRPAPRGGAVAEIRLTAQPAHAVVQRPVAS